LGLPDPDNEKTIEKHAVIASANIIMRLGVLKPYRKNGEYESYDECIRVKIGRFASRHGTATAVTATTDFRKNA